MVVNAGRLQQAVHAGMTLTPSKFEIKVRGHMKLAKLQISLRIDLLRHLATVAMTISPLPGLFLNNTWCARECEPKMGVWGRVPSGGPRGRVADETSGALKLARSLCLKQ